MAMFKSVFASFNTCACRIGLQIFGAFFGSFTSKPICSLSTAPVLQQIYLEVLPAEEYADVQMHDLLLSILMTMLPDTIYLFVPEEPLSTAEQLQQEKLLQLLRKIFGRRLIIAPHAYKP